MKRRMVAWMLVMSLTFLTLNQNVAAAGGVDQETEGEISEEDLLSEEESESEIVCEMPKEEETGILERDDDGMEETSEDEIEAMRLDSTLTKVPDVVVKSRDEEPSIFVTFSAVEGASGYLMSLSCDGNAVWEEEISDTSFTFEHLDFAQEYKLSISPFSYDEENGYVYETTWSESVITAPEENEISLSSISKEPSVLISWDYVKGVSGYEVIRSTGNNKDSVVFDLDSSSDSFKDTALEYGSKYYYVVRPYVINRDEKTYGSCKEKSVYTCPDVPVIKSCEAADYRSISLSWKKVSKCDGYKVYMKEEGASFVCVKTLKGNELTSHTVTKLETGKKYFFRVRAYRNNKEKVLGAWEKNVSCKPLPQAPSVRTSAGESSITVFFEKVKGADQYKIYRKTENSSFKLITVLEEDSESYVDQDVKAFTKYEYRAMWST